MVAVIRDSAPQTQANPAPISAEEEALKRNTDCVYFLASPLTCKKGAECEYRHSEYARVNPRDCWYWLNGNCLNPKCAFRHPPLDGLLGNQAAASAGSSFPQVHNAMPVASHASTGVAGSSKQAVPCIFFQKGHCLRGDRCAFQHLANPVGSKTQQTSLAAPISEPPNLAKKVFGSLEKCSQEQKKQPELPKPMVATVTAKAIPKINNVLPRNGVGVENDVQPFQAVDDVAYRSQASISAPVHTGNMQSRPSSRMHQSHAVEDLSFHNDREGDEFQRESSPGFDVLVDDELGDSEYYHGEDQYNRSAMGHEENLNSISEYEMDHRVDYNDLDHEPLYDSRGYDSYDCLQGEYRRDSSERIRAGPGYMERRSSKRNGGSPDYVDESDLRHRLSKQRRVNGLRSVVNQDVAPDSHFDGRNSFRASQRNSQLVSSQESSSGSRLRGRLKLLHRPPVGGNDLHSDRELDRGIARGRSPPQRSHGAPGRLQGRLKGRVQEDANNEGKNFRGWARKPVMDERSTNFAGPKSLAELKGMKQETDMQESSFVGKHKDFKPLNNQQPADDVSFEGPKPLSEILKRKREAEAAASSSDPLINKEENSRKEERETLLHNTSKEETKSTTVDADGTGDKRWHDQSSHPGEDDYEDGAIHDDAMEENELEENDQRNGEYDYDDQVDEGDYYEEGENAEGDGEDYLDDEDGDDFAKKVGVMFS